jgi:hypothetical protein
MDTCARCGHALDGGRFCTHCGTPLEAADDHEPTRQIPRLAVDEDPDDWRTGTAERPAVGRGTSRWDGRAGLPPTSPPPASPPPPAPPAYAPTGDPHDGPRFALFADEVDPAPVDGTDELPVTEPRIAHDHRRARPWLPWVAGALVLVLVAVLGGWLLLGDDSTPARAPEPAAATRDRTPSSGSDPTSGSGKPGRSSDVAASSVAHAPATAPPNQDLSGNLVRYEARNMLDGVPSTCWRMVGDGTGREIVLDLPGETRLTRVGLINGYAKVATDQRGRKLDWYAGNRRVLTVEWSFDDGTTVTQGLRETRRMQTLRIEPVTTSTVRLRLVSVSKPGAGRASRDYTPISDVTLRGSPA